MPRKFKSFITNLGFFELAVAAPSMKAALEAWGMRHNAFQHGFAKQTDDPKIVAATTDKPGVVLRRPVGSHGAFQEDAELPDRLPDLKPVRAAKTAAPKAKPEPKPRAKPEKKKKREVQDRAAVISFEKERARRARERAKEEAEEARDKARRDRAVEKAQDELDTARKQQDEAMAEIEAARDKLDRRERLAKDRWDAQRERLEAAVRRAEKQ